MPTSPPTLIVQTVSFAEGDRALAVELGTELYEHLTRSRQDRLAFGPGIPVRVATDADSVDRSAARHLLVVPVLGPASFGDADVRASAAAAIAAWHQELGPGHVVPVFTSPSWRAEEERLLGRPCLRKLFQ